MKNKIGKQTILMSLLLMLSLSVRAEWVDVTSYYLSNPSFDNNSTMGWVWSSNASSQKADYGCMEFWNGQFDFLAQNTLTLPKGRYRFSLFCFA